MPQRMYLLHSANWKRIRTMMRVSSILPSLFVGLLVCWKYATICEASRDDAYYPIGTENPLIETQSMYWRDSNNIFEDLDQFESLSIRFHSCVWSPSVSAYDNYYNQNNNNNNNNNNNGNNNGNSDYWYLGAMPRQEANVAFSLYGKLKNKNRFSRSSSLKCNEEHYINSFYTTDGFPVFLQTLATAQISDFVNLMNGNYNTDGNVYASYTTSSTCSSGYGVTCAGDGTFAVFKYGIAPLASLSTCHDSTTKQQVDGMEDLNSALKEEAKCVEIYNTASYVEGTVYTDLTTSSLSLLSYSSACTAMDPIGKCPDPFGKVKAYQKAYTNGAYFTNPAVPYRVRMVKLLLTLAVAVLLFMAAYRIYNIELDLVRTDKHMLTRWQKLTGKKQARNFFKDDDDRDTEVDDRDINDLHEEDYINDVRSDDYDEGCNIYPQLKKHINFGDADTSFCQGKECEEASSGSSEFSKVTGIKSMSKRRKAKQWEYLVQNLMKLKERKEAAAYEETVEVCVKPSLFSKVANEIQITVGSMQKDLAATVGFDLSPAHVRPKLEKLQQEKYKRQKELMKNQQSTKSSSRQHRTRSSDNSYSIKEIEITKYEQPNRHQSLLQRDEQDEFDDDTRGEVLSNSFSSYAYNNQSPNDNKVDTTGNNLKDPRYEEYLITYERPEVEAEHLKPRRSKNLKRMIHDSNDEDEEEVEPKLVGPSNSSNLWQSLESKSKDSGVARDINITRNESINGVGKNNKTVMKVESDVIDQSTTDRLEVADDEKLEENDADSVNESQCNSKTDISKNRSRTASAVLLPENQSVMESDDPSIHAKGTNDGNLGHENTNNSVSEEKRKKKFGGMIAKFVNQKYKKETSTEEVPKVETGSNSIKLDHNKPGEATGIASLAKKPSDAQMESHVAKESGANKTDRDEVASKKGGASILSGKKSISVKKDIESLHMKKQSSSFDGNAIQHILQQGRISAAPSLSKINTGSGFQDDDTIATTPSMAVTMKMQKESNQVLLSNEMTENVDKATEDEPLMIRNISSNIKPVNDINMEHDILQQQKLSHSIAKAGSKSIGGKISLKEPTTKNKIQDVDGTRSIARSMRSSGTAMQKQQDEPLNINDADPRDTPIMEPSMEITLTKNTKGNSGIDIQPEAIMDIREHIDTPSVALANSLKMSKSPTQLEQNHSEVLTKRLQTSVAQRNMEIVLDPNAPTLEYVEVREGGLVASPKNTEASTNQFSEVRALENMQQTGAIDSRDDADHVGISHHVKQGVVSEKSTTQFAPVPLHYTQSSPYRIKLTRGTKPKQELNYDNYVLMPNDSTYDPLEIKPASSDPGLVEQMQSLFNWLNSGPDYPAASSKATKKQLDEKDHYVSLAPPLSVIGHADDVYGDDIISYLTNDEDIKYEQKPTSKKNNTNSVVEAREEIELSTRDSTNAVLVFKSEREKLEQNQHQLNTVLSKETIRVEAPELTARTTGKPPLHKNSTPKKKGFLGFLGGKKKTSKAT